MNEAVITGARLSALLLSAMFILVGHDLVDTSKVPSWMKIMAFGSGNNEPELLDVLLNILILVWKTGTHMMACFTQ